MVTFLFKIKEENEKKFSQTGGITMRGNLLYVRIKNQKLLKKCKLLSLSRLSGVVIETLLELLFEKVNVRDIQRAYIENEVAGVKRLIREKLKKGE
jgi:hypothetical protein